MPAKSVKFYILPIYMLAVILLSVLPVNDSESAINHIFLVHIRLDYVFHMLMFLPWMGFLLIRKYSGVFSWFLAGTVFSLLSESVQYFLPYRAFNINDMIANFCGLSFGSLLVLIKKQRLAK